MKRIFFKIGILLELILVIGHLYVLRNGLPIPVVDEQSKTLTTLMRTYEIHFFGTEHTLNQTLTGYDYSWAVLAFFTFITSIIVVSIPLNEKKGKTYTLVTTILWLVTLVVAYINWGVPQQFLFASLFVTFLLSLLFDWKKPKPKDTKVCIVGAGISGLTAAHQLQKQGYSNVTVFEKENRVGGKCLTQLVDWHPYDMGGHEMLAGYYDLMQIAEEISVPSQTSVQPLVYDKNKNKYLNFKKAATESGKYNLIQVMWASIKYMYIVGIQFRKFSQPNSGFKNMPAELCYDLDTWLTKRKLLPLADIFSFVIKAQGYGGYGKTTAAYLVKFMGFKNWSSLLVANMGLSKKWPRVFVYGAQNFCERLAATVPDVRLNSTITKIERNNAEVQNGVKVYLEGKQEPILFDRLIITTPLAPAGLGFLELKQDDPDYVLFNQIKTIDVFMSLCEVQGLATGVVAWLPLTEAELRKGEPTGFIKDFAEEPYAFFLALLLEIKTGEEALKEIEKALAKMPPYYGVQPKLIRKVVQHKWQYFPHIDDQQALLNGYYDKLEALQGQKQTYYANSALSFECMGNCVGYAKKLIVDNF